MLTDTQRSEIITLRKQGHPCTEIGIRLGLKKHVVQCFVYKQNLSYKVVGLSPSAKRYDWRAVQAFYDDGHTRKECLIKFNMSTSAWDYASKRSNQLKVRPKIPRGDYFKLYRHRGCSSLKYHMQKMGLITNKCSICGLSDWMGKPIPIQIDHIDGDHANNRISNLRELCPNCHSQTPTFGNKEGKRVRGTNTETKIRQMSAEGKSDLSIAKELECSPKTVASIVRGWRRRYV